MNLEPVNLLLTCTKGYIIETLSRQKMIHPTKHAQKLGTTFTSSTSRQIINFTALSDKQESLIKRYSKIHLSCKTPSF